MGLTPRKRPSRSRARSRLSSTRVPPLRTPSVAYSVEFYGGHKVDVSLCLINDIEILMKRINSVFYCMSHTMGLESLERALDLLGRFRGCWPSWRPSSFPV